MGEQSLLGTQGHVKDQKMVPPPLAVVPVPELQELTGKQASLEEACSGFYGSPGPE